MRRSLSAIMVCPLLFACFEGQQSHEQATDLPATCAADDPACDPYDEVHFLGTWATDVCRFLQDCCEPPDSLTALRHLFGLENAAQAMALEPELLSDRDACVRAVALGLSGQIVDDVVALTEDRRVFDRDAAESCLGYVGLSADVCAPSLMFQDASNAPAACGEMFRPAVGPGGVCYSSDDCKEQPDGGESTCWNAGGARDGGTLISSVGTCEPTPGLDEPCSAVEGACGAGLFCDPDSFTCRGQGALGASCAGAPCSVAGYCDTTDFTCRVRVRAGEACRSDEECVVGTGCDVSTHVCRSVKGPSPLEAEYNFCLGDGDNRTLRDVLPDALVDPFLSDIAARFVVQASATLVAAVEADEECGMAATEIVPVVEGAPGEIGEARYEVQGCALAEDTRELISSCIAEGTVGGGAAVVSAVKTVRGLVTGDPRVPIIPVDEDAVTYVIEADLSPWEVSTAGITVRFHSGALSSTFRPRTSRSLSTGACSVPTLMASFEDISLEDAAITVTSGLGLHERTIDVASLHAIAGGADGETNVLEGSLTLDGTAREVPLDEAGLDPGFEPVAFAASWQCAEDLAQPTTEACDFVEQTSHGAAALSIRLMGVIADVIDRDTSCGFSNADVASTGDVTGALGQDAAALTLTLPSPCTLTFPEQTVVATDCNGQEVRLQGAVEIEGTKTVRGFLTGDPQLPLVPTSSSAASLALSIRFDELSMTFSDGSVGLAVADGLLTGRVTPTLALDAATGACSIATPIAAFDDVTWSDAALAVLTPDVTVPLPVSSASLRAQSGAGGEGSLGENAIEGSMTVDGVEYGIPSTLGGALDPDYDAEQFLASFQCVPGLVLPDDVTDCSFRQVLGKLSAVALVQQVATATRILEADATCGFSSNAVLSSGQLSGDVGGAGVAVWTTSGCSVGPLPADTPLATDCVGTTLQAGGSFTASAEKTLMGLRSDDPPVLPVEPSAVTFSVTAFSLTGFEASLLPDGLAVAPLKSRVTGAGTAVVRPLVGPSASAPGVYSVPTPVLEVDDISLPEAEVTLFLGNSTFHVSLSDVSLRAFVGAFGGQSNSVTGSLIVDGEAVELPVGTLLDDQYEQAAFDASYACTPDLAAPLSP